MLGQTAGSPLSGFLTASNAPSVALYPALLINCNIMEMGVSLKTIEILKMSDITYNFQKIYFRNKPINKYFKILHAFLKFLLWRGPLHLKNQKVQNMKKLMENKILQDNVLDFCFEN
jgi:hypothetical protein